VSGRLHTPAVFPLGKSPRYPLYRRLGGPQSRSGHYGLERNTFPSPGIESVAIPTELSRLTERPADIFSSELLVLEKKKCRQLTVLLTDQFTLWLYVQEVSCVGNMGRSRTPPTTLFVRGLWFCMLGPARYQVALRALVHWKRKSAKSCDEEFVRTRTVKALQRTLTRSGGEQYTQKVPERLGQLEVAPHKP
jgi:hypothetical protein